MKTLKKLLLLGVVCCSAVSFAEISEKDFSKAFETYLQTESGQDKISEAMQSYFKRKQEQSKVERAKAEKASFEEQFENPIKVEIGGSPVIGKKDAKVTIIEFSDFECPFCVRGKKTMEEVLKAYPDDVKVVFKNLPLDFHKNAKPAAYAALAAGEQGKYWEMHDKIFDNSKSLNEAFYKTAAKELGLDIAKFEKDMASDKVIKQVEDDMAVARKAGFTGTPGFLVNGVAVKGAYPFDHFKSIIDRWLEKK